MANITEVIVRRPETKTLTISSTQTTYKNSYGNRITVNLNPPLHVGGNARIALKKGSFWYSFNNVSSGFNNNKIVFNYDTEEYIITLTNGLYSIDSINYNIVNFLESNQLPTTLFLIDGDDATNLCNLNILPVGGLNFNMDFTDERNLLFKNLLGFNGFVSTEVAYNRIANNTANLNSNTDIYIYCSIADGGYLNNNVGSSIIDVVPLDVRPNTLKSFEPINPSYLRINTNIISTIDIYLLNQNGDDVDCNGENFTLKFDIEYIK